MLTVCGDDTAVLSIHGRYTSTARVTLSVGRPKIHSNVGLKSSCTKQWWKRMCWDQLRASLLKPVLKLQKCHPDRGVSNVREVLNHLTVTFTYTQFYNITPQVWTSTYLSASCLRREEQSPPLKRKQSHPAMGWNVFGADCCSALSGYTPSAHSPNRTDCSFKKIAVFLPNESKYSLSFQKKRKHF